LPAASFNHAVYVMPGHPAVAQAAFLGHGAPQRRVFLLGDVRRLNIVLIENLELWTVLNALTRVTISSLVVSVCSDLLIRCVSSYGLLLEYSGCQVTKVNLRGAAGISGLAKLSILHG
jgi:hypothetical protein